MKSIESISPKTKLCGIIGNPVEHSMSPALHNRGFVELGLDYAYLAFRVASGSVAKVLDAMRVMDNFVGLSVTIPHKVEVVSFVDKVSDVDAAIGSINTVVQEDGVLRGLGSDGPGARQALLDAQINPADGQVVILGTGGASRAIAFDLAFNAKPEKIILLGVIENEVQQLAKDLNDKSGASVEGILLSDDTLAASLSAPGVLINATPIGMHPKINDSIVPAALLHGELSVMDIIYNPLETQLLQDAKAKGLKTVGGLDMFVNQAIIQFETWTGQAAPREIMRQVVLSRLSGQ